MERPQQTLVGRADERVDENTQSHYKGRADTVRSGHVFVGASSGCLLAYALALPPCRGPPPQGLCPSQVGPGPCLKSVRRQMAKPLESVAPPLRFSFMGMEPRVSLWGTCLWLGQARPSDTPHPLLHRGHAGPPTTPPARELTPCGRVLGLAW